MTRRRSRVDAIGRSKGAARSSLGAQVTAGLLLVGGACAFPALIAYDTWSNVQKLKREWTVEGPACPVVVRPAGFAVSHRRPPRTFRYGDIVFSRSFAAASCAAIPESALWTRESYRVCQFNNPGAVTVTTGARSVTFQPPIGQRATVTVRRGEVHCVVGGTFSR